MKLQDKFNEGGGTGRASFELGYITEDKIGKYYKSLETMKITMVSLPP